ncbi:MAG: NAD(P)/FAD-dependent oxidoreductase [Ignavibacteria bacterium]|nr:NAD(P)/FAD-dependent oxidoreductase [Ignavibacteria bacterium]
MKTDKNKTLIVVGAGFAGLQLVKSLKNSPVRIVLIDKSNHHLFQPLLYQVAVSALSPADISAPIRTILKRQKNVEVILGEVTDIDKSNKSVTVDGQKVNFDFLVLAPGSRHSYFGKDNWEENAPGLKTLKDALNIRENMLVSFEEAENEAFLTGRNIPVKFVVIGGGPTGVEIAGSLAEIATKTLRNDFRNIDTRQTKIILVEGSGRLLGAYDSPLNEKAAENLRNMGVEVRLNTMVTNIDEKGVTLGDERIETHNIIWAAGNTASPLIKTLGTETDRMGRAMVRENCSIKESEDIFVIGDAANFIENGQSLPGIAPVAMQQGRYIGKLIKNRLENRTVPGFVYSNKGSMATIGRAKAIFQAGNIKLSGFIAWVLWAFIHIMYLIGFRNRYRVMAEWVWYYISFKPGARLITGEPRKMH